MDADNNGTLSVKEVKDALKVTSGLGGSLQRLFAFLR